jgi:hypothetical protein
MRRHRLALALAGLTLLAAGMLAVLAATAGTAVRGRTPAIPALTSTTLPPTPPGGAAPPTLPPSTAVEAP